MDSNEYPYEKTYMQLCDPNFSKNLTIFIKNRIKRKIEDIREKQHTCLSHSNKSSVINRLQQILTNLEDKINA